MDDSLITLVKSFDYLQKQCVLSRHKLNYIIQSYTIKDFLGHVCNLHIHLMNRKIIKSVASLKNFLSGSCLFALKKDEWKDKKPNDDIDLYV